MVAASLLSTKTFDAVAVVDPATATLGGPVVKTGGDSGAAACLPTSPLKILDLRRQTIEQLKDV